MNSSILTTSIRVLLPLLALVALHLLLRGHHEPGGGFIAGLVSAGVLALVALVEGPAAARRLLRANPVSLIALGLLVACASTLPAALAGQPPLSGRWFLWGDLHLGTPLLFDLGVFLLVVGAACAFIFHMLEHEHDNGGEA